jgi:undecaprenyl-diphosphatase
MASSLAARAPLRWTGAAALALLVLLAALVVARHGEPFPADLRAGRAAIAHRAPLLTALASALHVLGKYPLILLYGFAIAALAWARAERRKAAAVVVVVVGLAAWLEVLKHAVGRARPDPALWLVKDTGPSFPSGHSAGTFALSLVGLALLRRLARPSAARHLAAAALVAVPLATGASRVYLGLHYASDVAAAWLLATAWFCACWSFA